MNYEGYALNSKVRDYQVNPVKITPTNQQTPSVLDERGIKSRIFKLNKYIANLRNVQNQTDQMRKAMYDFEQELADLKKLGHKE